MLLYGRLHGILARTIYLVEFKMAASGMLAEFKVGEISQALLSKPKKKKVEVKENSELDALFSTAGLFQPQFISAASRSKVSLLCI